MRYSRQLVLDSIGQDGQKALGKSTALIVGVGALGSWSSELLVRAGIGRLALVDRDVVCVENLQSQFYAESDVGFPKVVAAQRRLRAVNQSANVKGLVADLDFRAIGLLSGYDIILDCTDNFETRFLINEFCVKNSLPLVYASVVRDLGALFCVLPKGPCLACIFRGKVSVDTCDTSGLLNSAALATAALQVSESLKILLGNSASPDLIRINLRKPEMLAIKVGRKIDCPCCLGRYSYLEGKGSSTAVRLCGTGTYQVSGGAVDLPRLKKRLGGKVKDFGYCIQYRGMVLFHDGRALIKADSKGKARAQYAKVLG